MAFAKFQEYWVRIDGEIAKNHSILVNLTTSIGLGHARLQLRYRWGHLVTGD